MSPCETRMAGHHYENIYTHRSRHVVSILLSGWSLHVGHSVLRPGANGHRIGRSRIVSHRHGIFLWRDALVGRPKMFLKAGRLPLPIESQIRSHHAATKDSPRVHLPSFVKVDYDHNNTPPTALAVFGRQQPRFRRIDHTQEQQSEPTLLTLVFERRAEAMAQDIFADAASLAAAGFLIETEMNTACDSRLIDIVRDLLEGCILQNNFGNSRVAERDAVAALAEHSFKHRARGSAKAGVPGRIGGKRRREDQ